MLLMHSANVKITLIRFGLSTRQRELKGKDRDVRHHHPSICHIFVSYCTIDDPHMKMLFSSSDLCLVP